MGTLDRLKDLDACTPALDWLATQPTLRAAWEDCEKRDWLMWLVGRAHSAGTLTRQRLVQVAIRCVEPVLHLTTDEVAADLGVVAQWTVGGATIEEVAAARDRLDAAANDAAYAAYAAYAAAYAAAAAAAYAAAAAAAYAAAYAAAAAAAYAAPCDVIRSAITLDEVAAALGLDPDEQTAREAA